ncbi:general transcription repressor [Diplodia seriata]|uniref:General transcription repressor n=1 Tax=Diplodia seriata TaxID=420778 RepID=A0ABR3CN89_9PEZI
MYNAHRGMVPGAQPNRLQELLDQVRQEFENEAGRAGEMERQLATQLQEMDLVRTKIYQLEQAQIAMKAKYEEELQRLQRQLDAAGGPSHSSHATVLRLHEPPNALAASTPNVGNTLAELDPDHVDERFKREGGDWFAIFNPRVRRVLDVNLVHTLPHQSVVCCVRFSADGRFVATGCNRSAQIFDVQSGALRAHLQDSSLGEDGDLYIRSVCFSPDGKYLATGAEDKIIRVWDIETRSIRHQFAGHDQDIYSLDFARNGRLIASGSGDRTVRLWDISTNQQVLQLSIEDGVTTVAISPDNRFVAAGSLDKSVRVWDTSSGYLVERLEGDVGHKDSVYSVAFAPNGKDLVSGSLDKTIKMWELSTPPRNIPGSAPKGGKCIKTFEGHKDFVLSVALTPDGAWVLSGSKDRGVQFWDPVTGVAQLMLQGHKNSVISVAPSPMGNLFATGSGDMRARIWRYVRT